MSRMGIEYCPKRILEWVTKECRKKRLTTTIMIWKNMTAKKVISGE